MPLEVDPRSGSNDKFWNKVYVGVIITTVAVITALWMFSRYFA